MRLGPEISMEGSLTLSVRTWQPPCLIVTESCLVEVPVSASPVQKRLRWMREYALHRIPPGTALQHALCLVLLLSQLWDAFVPDETGPHGQLLCSPEGTLPIMGGGQSLLPVNGMTRLPSRSMMWSR